MPSPFPGMDPYLEHPDLWPDVHKSLLIALANDLSSVLRPRYYVAVEERAYVGEMIMPPMCSDSGRAASSMGSGPARTRIVEVELPMVETVREVYLEVRGVSEGQVVTVIELLSPSNKRPGTGRSIYLEKREAILATQTSLVEIDLLRGGEPMPTRGPRVGSDYSILVSRPQRRPKADLIAFGVRDPIPEFPLPLRRGEEEPKVDLGRVLHALYDRASYDLRIDYGADPVPPLVAADGEWAAGRKPGH